MFTSNYSIIVDTEKFKKIPTMVLLLIFQYLNDELFIMTYNKNIKDLCLVINKKYHIITKSLIYKQLHPANYSTITRDILIYDRNYNLNNYGPVTEKFISYSIPKQGLFTEKIRYNNDNTIDNHYCIIQYQKCKKHKRRRSHSPM